MDNKRSLIEIIKKPGGEFLKDVTELGVDKIIETITQDADILKSIPIIKWGFLGHTIKNNIQLSFFLKKYASFIGPIQQEIPDHFWDDKIINELIDSKTNFSTLIEETIVALDRYQVVNKAKILGELFVKTFKEKKFTITEYNTLIFSIELMHPSLGVECLKQFYDYKLRMDTAVDDKQRRDVWGEGSKLDFSPLSSTCLIQLPTGRTSTGNLGGAYLNDLGQKFYEEVVSKI